jgi:16S rRNA (guanine527-N7)-methyltransferase
VATYGAGGAALDGAIWAGEMPAADHLGLLAARLGVELDAARRERLKTFCDLLLVWNARINLTGARDAGELDGEHLLDAVALAALVPPGARLLDVGSGGGLPAVPFAVLRPDVALTLVEPRAKRVAFLRTALRAVGSSAQVHGERVEDLGIEAGAFDVAASRATFEPVEWLSLGRGLAPTIVVFASRVVEAPPGFRVGSSIEYATGRGHPRWVAAFHISN